MARSTDEIKELLKRDSVQTFFVRGELKSLPTLLGPEEQVEKILRGRYARHRGVLAATNRRLIFLDKGLGHAHFEEFRYENITSVGMKSGVWGGAIVIHVAGNAAEIDQVNKGDAAMLTDFVRDKLAQISEPTRGDPIQPVPSISAEDAVSRLEDWPA